MANENVIFLISQPRAGSTLLQRELGRHSEILTVSEPWLMLYPSYCLRTEGYEAEYNRRLAQNGLKDFLERLPNGEKTYYEGVRRMYGYLYKQALAGTNCRYFLDKTPRYYLVIPEILQSFPDAKYLVLLRNPLAVLCSIINTWTGSVWPLLAKFRSDLLQAPDCLLEGIEILKQQCTVTHYEKLVEDPEHELRRLCTVLDLAYEPDMINYGQDELARWRMGDKGTIYNQSHPVATNAEKWRASLSNPQIWKYAKEYLCYLGCTTIEAMGYSYPELEHALDSVKPGRARLFFQLSLHSTLKKPFTEQPIALQLAARLARSVEQKGVAMTMKAARRKIKQGVLKPK
jgi:hypothetical protein